MQEIEALLDQVMVQTMEQCRVMYETRLTALEGLVEQQQVQLGQLQQLGELDERLERLAHEVSALHLDHAELHDDSQAVAECLVANGTLSVPQLQARRKSCQSLSAFCSLVESPERCKAMVQLLGAKAPELHHLRPASRAFSKAAPNGKATVTPEEAKNNAASELDPSVFQRLKDYEPPRAELDKWERNVTVNTVMASFKVEGLIGRTEVLKFSDVLKILSQLGMTLDQFVSKFTLKRRSRTAEELQETANAVLAKFATRRLENEKAISCRDVYRLLEIIGYPLQRFKSLYNGADDPEQNQAVQQKLGGYKIKSQIGQDAKSVCYLGEHVSDQTRVVIKWPAPREELAALKDIQRAAPKGCLGVPRLLAHGDSQREPYFITELLGSRLTKVFQVLHESSISADKRWQAISVIGRLALRRLEALHTRGFVHCDISPENIVLGRAGESAEGSPLYTLYLMDFEHVQKYPGGRALPIDCGSAEWSSVRSAEGGERLPEDDLEALGWVLMSGHLGDLPWFSWLTAAYKDWESQWTRHQVVRQVQKEKTQFLEAGWKSFCGRKALRMPKELAGFIPACHPGSEAGAKPDYASLISLLGGSPDLSVEEAEKADISCFTEHLSML